MYFPNSVQKLRLIVQDNTHDIYFMPCLLLLPYPTGMLLY